MKKYLAEIGLLILSLIIIFGSFQINSEQIIQDEMPIQLEEVPSIKMAWGFPTDSIQIDSFKIRQNQSLSDILMAEGISALAVDQLAKNSKEVFDVRRIKSGNPYYILSRDSATSPDYFIYEETAIDYIVFNLNKLDVSRGQKQIDTKTKSISGVIKSSLWNSLVDNGSSPTLALELSDIFAWTVDFFGIQRGDQYQVLYDELYVDENYVGTGQVYAASFINMGDTIFAYYFNKGSQEGYFDDKGQSLKKAFLKAPLQFSRISSRFSNNRYHPVLKIRRPHHGVDYAAPIGTPVLSIGDGLVVKKAYQKAGGGNYLTIKHNSVYTSQYMHLNGFAKGIAAGVRVKQGQLIAYVGKTGLATGPHLDFRIYKNGTAVDPLKVKAPPVEPINIENQALFIHQRDSLKLLLGSIPIFTENE
ncbi:MAG: M23 family metallopeptidase [Prolixibacteraceae bacterium]